MWRQPHRQSMGSPAFVGGLTPEQVEQFVIDYFGLTPNTKQTIGVAYDATTHKGNRVEIKTDAASTTTGNYFLETLQTFNDWQTSKPSGVSLSFQQADFLAFLNHTQLIIVPTQKLKQWLSLQVALGRAKTRYCRRGTNDNKPGWSTKGYLAPVADVTKLAVARYECEAAFTPEWTFRQIEPG